MLFKYSVLSVLIVNVWCQNLYFFDESIGTLDETKFENIKDKTQIHFLDLRGNGIKRVLDTAFQGFDNLYILALRQNYIECLPEDVFHDVQQVNHLELNSNKLKYLHKNIFSKLSKLRVLRLSDNSLTKLEVGLFDNNAALEELNLQDNRLTYIPEGLFSKLNKLVVIDLGSNYIQYIDRNAMPSAVPTNLKYIWLWSNRLQHFDLYDSILNSLMSGNLDKNRWYCDCKLKRLYKKWASNFKGNGWEPACDGPAQLKNRMWTSLKESDFVCDHNAVHFRLETNKFPLIGENVILACHINIPVGDIAITYKNGTNVVEHLRRRRRFPSVQSDSTEEQSWYKLTIKDVQPHDTGYYNCVINGKAEREILLNVDDPSYYEKCVANVSFP